MECVAAIAKDQPTPLRFVGVGEKIDDLKVFNNDKTATLARMGDIVSLVEKASQGLDEEKLKKKEEQFKKTINLVTI